MAKTAQQKKAPASGTIYLLCFSQKYRHARHYLGFAEVLEDRLKEHNSGQGAKFTRVLKRAGITLECVRIWTGTRELERHLKNRHDARSLCPKCKAQRNAEKQFSRMMRQLKKEWRKIRDCE